MYAKTQERIKVIECGFISLKGVCWAPNARRLTKLEPNETFNDFFISRKPCDEIDSNFFYFKGMD